MKDLILYGIKILYIFFEGLYKEGKKKIGVIVISGDKGLCGGYNVNVLRSIISLYENFVKEGDVMFFFIGVVG